jgi:hypothetical protein
MNILLLIGIIAILCTYSYLGIKMNKGKKSKVIPKNIKDEFVEIKSFNEDKYIEDTFEDIFHSVQIDNWDLGVNYEEIKFSKNKVDLKVKYKIEGGIFTISAIYLSAGTFFSHKGDIKEKDYKFFYQKYADYKNEFNKNSKDNCDKSMKKIHNIIGKSTLRDTKLNKILNK